MARLNLRDDQWERIEHLLPGKASDPRADGSWQPLVCGGDLVVGSLGSPVARSSPGVWKLEPRVL